MNCDTTLTLRFPLPAAALAALTPLVEEGGFSAEWDGEPADLLAIPDGIVRLFSREFVKAEPLQIAATAHHFSFSLLTQSYETEPHGSWINFYDAKDGRLGEADCDSRGQPYIPISELMAGDKESLIDYYRLPQDLIESEEVES